MRAPASRLATIALAVSLLALGGCGRLSSGPIHACNMKSTSWAAKANGAVPGIDEASVTAITLSIGTNGQTNVYPVVLFLVSTRQPPCVIAQVPYNLADFPSDKDALKKLAESDPTIGDFFRKHAGTDAPR